MFPFHLRLASRHPFSMIGKKKYLNLSGVVALRLDLRSAPKSSALRLKIDDNVILEEKTNSRHHTKSTDNNDFVNLWFEIPQNAKKTFKIIIQLKYFGVYFNALTLDVVSDGGRDQEVLKLSDAFVDPNNLGDEILSNAELVRRIQALPSSVRSMESLKITREIKKILVLRLDQLGDFILTVPAIVRLKNIFKDAEITAMVSPANAPCARALGLFSEIVEVPFSFEPGTNVRVLSDQARQVVIASGASTKYDLAVDLSVMPESRSLLSLVAVNYKVGFENVESSMLDLGILIHAKDPINLLSNVSHSVYPLLIVDAIGLALKPEIPHLPLSLDKSTLLGGFNLRPGNYTVIHSGARNLLARWPQEYFIEVATQVSQAGERIVFFSDDPLAPAERDRLAALNAHVFEGGMAFDLFDAILSFARAYIGNDTGPKHLAAMRGVPVISVHAARSNWSEWGQIDSGYTISRRVPCAGCGITTKEECGRDLVCLTNIKVEEVIDCYHLLSRAH